MKTRLKDFSELLGLVIGILIAVFFIVLWRYSVAGEVTSFLLNPLVFLALVSDVILGALAVEYSEIRFLITILIFHSLVGLSIGAAVKKYGWTVLLGIALLIVVYILLAFRSFQRSGLPGAV